MYIYLSYDIIANFNFRHIIDFYPALISVQFTQFDALAEFFSKICSWHLLNSKLSALELYRRYMYIGITHYSLSGHERAEHFQLLPKTISNAALPSALSHSLTLSVFLHNSLTICKQFH